MLERIYSFLFWSFMALNTVVMFPFILILRVVTHPFDRRLVWVHRYTSLWAAIQTWCNPLWRVEIIGREKIDRKKTYVMVANHQSLLDILVLHRLFVHFKWVSRHEIFRVPIIGWSMSMNRYVSIRRGRVAGFVEMMRDCKKNLEDGNSVIIFPEGTRSLEGKMRSFQEGAFELAIGNQKPIIPLVIYGTAQALPRTGFILRGRHDIKVHVLDEIPPESFAGVESSELAEKVHALMLAELQSMRPATAQADSASESVETQE